MSSGIAPPRAERLVPRDAAVRINLLLRTFACASADEVNERVGQLCAPDVVYADPLARAQGAPAMAAHVDFLRRVQLGRRMVLASGVDEVHDYARFGWRLTDPRGRVQFEGICHVRFDQDGRFAEVIAFVGPLPSVQMRVTVPQKGGR